MLDSRPPGDGVIHESGPAGERIGNPRKQRTREFLGKIL